MDNATIHERYSALSGQLKQEMNGNGFWTGRLSSSALSTAVAIVALKTANHEGDKDRITAGFEWLNRNINHDGGYGDTPDSVSNVSTTLLCYAAISYCQTGGSGAVLLRKMREWLEGNGIVMDPATITGSVLKFYGQDLTFSLPIVSMLALCGIIDYPSLEKVPRLPFELTLLPASWYRFFNLRVVSYALPALIGVGIFLHRHRKWGFPGGGKVRDKFVGPAVTKLNSLVPESGGFLEAVPLTGFVAMCLIASEEPDNVTVTKGLHFLRDQQRNDGGWPIDTDLSTWVTTLSVKALGSGIYQVLNTEQITALRKHLLDLQYKTVHPFNGAGPGGWGWTNFTGSVPDADDTPGAILALLELYSGSRGEVTAIENGCRWLIGIQNRDGGFPTFCRGWGKLPFDRSCADLTGHALLAFIRTVDRLNGEIDHKLLRKIIKSIAGALDYLSAHQSEDGSWIPLWFGNQYAEDKTNPVYGTAKVGIYLADCLKLKIPDKKIADRISRLVNNAMTFLVSQQNPDGSWGGKKNITGTVEETALAVCALADVYEDARLRGISWMAERDSLKASPIGLYFALLWYDEKMYPLIYYTEALRRFLGY